MTDKVNAPYSSTFGDHDTNIIKELETHDIEGMSPRSKMAIRDLAELNQGSVIFLFLSMNSRIRDLENALAGAFAGETKN